MTKRHRRWVAGRATQAAISLAAAALMAASFASAATRGDRPSKTTDLSGVTLESALQVDSAPAILTQRLQSRQQGGSHTIIARLKSPAVAAGGNAGRIDAEQQAFIARVLAASPGSKVLATVRVVSNAVFLETDRAGLGAVSADASVSRVAPVGDYQIELTETVPYIGAETVHGLGLRGSGVRVAVLDSGADYTHADLGGSGNPADYAANDPTTLADGGFPNSKFIGGADFVGSHWPLGASCLATSTGPLEPDADPMDKPAAGCPEQSGHGTHVSSIIAGIQGVAPDAKMYAVKVCSATTTSCSGIALIQGMEFAVDPNGDGNPSDHADIINMSLGSNYGQPFDDDLSFAVENATQAGVLTVAAAGNASDKPYIVSTPSAALSAISVAQTTVPSDKLNRMHINAPVVANPDRLAIWQPWSAPLTTTISGPVTYGNGAGGNLDGCAPFTVPLSGIVLVNRGTCNISVKSANVGAAGGSLAIIGMIVAGQPPTQFAFGGGTQLIPAFNITLADANAIRTGGNVTFDPTNIVALSGTMIATSARGPMFQDHRIKPEIGAPGGSVSAEHGQGTGRTAFGGTSGATPMIAGSAALLKQFYRIIGENDEPAALKQILMNSAETNILAPSVPGGLIPDVLAPISRIGAGEVRVDRAVALKASVNPQDSLGNWSGGLGFGFVDVSKASVSITKDVLVTNRTLQRRTYTIAATARYADDVTNGAVSLSLPASVTLGPKQFKTIKVKLTIDGTKLRNNLMSSGSGGNNPALLTANEYDGYLVFQSQTDSETLTLPWHVLPRKAARLTKPNGGTLSGNEFPIDPTTLEGTVNIKNNGVGTAQIDTYTLVAVSNNLPAGGQGEQAPTPDIHAFAVNTIVGVPTSTCSAGWLWEFAFNSWGRQTMPTGYIYDVFLDINQDGIFDWDVFNFDNSLSNAVSDGRQVTWAANMATGAATAFFFAEHSTNTGNTVLRVCGNQVGLTSAAILSRNVNVVVTASDFFFGGPGDEIDGITITPFGEQFVGGANDLAAGASGTFTALDFTPFPGNTPELGLMIISNGDRGAASRGGATEDTESILLARPGGSVFAE